MTKTYFTGFLMMDAAARMDAAHPKRRRRAREGAATTRVADAMAAVEAGQSVVLQLDPSLADGDRPAVAAFLAALVRTAEQADIIKQEALIARLAEVMLPDDLAEARAVLAADNLEARDRFVATVPVLTSKDVAASSGTTSRNPYATTARWRDAGRIFSVSHRGRDHFPAFQFRDGQPHPAIRTALAALPSDMSPWQRAFWFVSTNGWLGGRTPAECLNDRAALVAAAQREAEPLVG